MLKKNFNDILNTMLFKTVKETADELKKYGKVTFQMQPSESGQKQSVTYLNEKQAIEDKKIADELKIKEWTQREPSSSFIVKDLKANRIICVYL